jgi:uncharacterized protein YggE
MRHIAFAAALAASLALSVPAYAQTANPPPSITVTGEAQASAPPDLAEIDGGVATEARSAREASEANAKAMTAVMAALKGLGIAERDIRTSRISIFPQMAQGGPGGQGTPRIASYRATNHVAVRLRDIAKVAETIDALVAAGANELGGINFIVSEPSKLLDKARSEAVADARRKAEIYAQAANVTIGAPLAISEDGAAPPPMPYRMDRAAVGKMATPVAPGEQTLRVGVSVTWEIKGK